MSEFQYYEFQTVERFLSDQEQRAIRKLSSRVELTSNRAVFTYQFGDFPSDPKQILLRYFDAMLYLANWGSRRLMFCLPKSEVSFREIQSYAVEGFISVTVRRDQVLLDFDLNEEGCESWVDGEGKLSSLIRLREDILNGDYRSLYLAWLKAITLLEDKEIGRMKGIPPIPCGLCELSRPLRDFVRLFDIPSDLIAITAKESRAPETLSQEVLRRAIAKLPRNEITAHLLRLALGERHLAADLNRRLRRLVKGKDCSKPQKMPWRSAGELLEAADHVQKTQGNIKNAASKD
jgi:hypothetical protein